MAGFSPGTSPPPVKIPMTPLAFVAITQPPGAKSRRLPPWPVLLADLTLFDSNTGEQEQQMANTTTF
jgi:hypothetical protein